LDEHLLAIIQAAEAGLECPPVRVLTGGLAILGVPGRPSEFLEVSTDELIDQYVGYVDGRSRRERKDEDIDPEAKANEHLGNVRWPTASADSVPQALTLLDARIWPIAGGDALELPALRLPVRNIQAWWIAGGTVIDEKKDRSWWIVVV